VTAADPPAITVIAVAGEVNCAMPPAIAAATPCMVSIPEECNPKACPLSSPGVRAISRSWSSRLAEKPIDATVTAASATGSGGRRAKTRYGRASISSSGGAPNRSRHRAGRKRPVRVSPASMPTAAKANSRPAWRGA
jgi:hypothetical protein